MNLVSRNAVATSLQEVELIKKGHSETTFGMALIGMRYVVALEKSKWRAR